MTRSAGRSKWSYPKLVRLAIDGITSFSTEPLRVASYMGGIVSVLALVRVVVDLRHMILALPVLVLGPLALRYGYEIRMYALLMLLAALGTLLLFHATRVEDALARGRSDATARRRVWVWWVLYAVVVCLGMLTQYLIAFLWAVQAVWLLARTLHTHPARGDASSWRWLAAYALAVILYLPWLPHAIDQFRHNVLPSLKGMFGPGRLAELVTAWLTGLDASHLTGFVTLGLLAVAGVLLWSRPRVAAAWRPLVLMWVAPAIVLIVVAAIRELLYAPYGGFFTVRYSCAFQPFVYATMGLVVAGLALRRWNDGGATATTVETETPIGEAAAGQCTPGSAAGVPGSSWSR